MINLIKNKLNSMPQQVQENKNNIDLINKNMFTIDYKGIIENDNGVTYNKWDMVQYQNKLYVCIVDESVFAYDSIYFSENWGRITGDKGDTKTINVGQVQTNTIDSEQNANVDITEYQYSDNTTLDFLFNIPKGRQGEQGIQGIQGENGVTPTFNIGSVSAVSVAPNAQPSVTVTAVDTGNYEYLLNFSFSIPQGQQGESGAVFENPIANSYSTDMNSVYSCDYINNLALSLQGYVNMQINGLEPGLLYAGSIVLNNNYTAIIINNLVVAKNKKYRFAINMGDNNNGNLVQFHEIYTGENGGNFDYNNASIELIQYSNGIMNIRQDKYVNFYINIDSTTGNGTVALYNPPRTDIDFSQGSVAQYYGSGSRIYVKVYQYT